MLKSTRPFLFSISNLPCRLRHTKTYRNGRWVPYAEDSTEQLEEDANLIIMRVGEEDGEEYLDVVDDDEELYEVSDMFARRLEELYDIDLNGGQ